MEELDVILITHNRLEQTIKCLNCLYRYTKVPFRLTVIDDSLDLTPKFFEGFQQEHDNVQYIQPVEILENGNQILNIGLRNTKNELILNLNQSTFVEPYYLNIALNIMKENPEVGIVGFKLLYPHGTIIEAGAMVYPETAQRENIGMYEAGHRHSYVREVDAVGFAVALLRRAAIPKGGFEEDYYIGFRGSDDVDNCLEIQQRGWNIIYCGLGCAYHELRACQGGGTREGFEEMVENSKRFAKRWKGRKVKEKK